MTASESPKYDKYQDYVIKDGQFIGEFEQMYVDYEEPWEQITREDNASEKIIGLHLLSCLKARKAIELGCGLGYYTQKIHDQGIDVLGVDISPTAIKKAQQSHPDCKFKAADILDFDIYREFKPDVVIMAEITWYILDKLDEFISFFKKELPGTYLLHFLATYPPGVQKYGKDKFTNLEEIMNYFDANYVEWGQINRSEYNGVSRTYFLGYW